MNEREEIYFGENPPSEDVLRLREAYRKNPEEIEARMRAVADLDFDDEIKRLKEDEIAAVQKRFEEALGDK